MNPLTKYLETYFDEIESRDFYREIFPEGELDQKDQFSKGKYTGVIVEVTKDKKKNGKPKIKRYTLTDDLDAIDQVLKTDNFCLAAPISYAGKTRTAENSRFLYAMAFDLDGVIVTENGTPQGLIDLFYQIDGPLERLPRPTMIVSSGTGLHLYYVFDKPIPLFDNIAKQLQKYKYRMTQMLWQGYITEFEENVQQEGIYQGFRIPGTITKTGERARAFVTGRRVTMEYMNSFVDDKNQVTEYTYKSNLPLSKAKELYPEWYEKRIVKGEKKGSWHISRNLYDWWKDQIYEGATLHHRYYCLMILVIYAKKCSMYDEKHNPNPVTREELEKDAFELMDFLEEMTDKEDNHFDEGDVLDALEAYDDKFITYPRNSIQNRSGIIIKKNKRNRRKQETHIKIMNTMRKFMIENQELEEDWYNRGGRPVGSGTKEKLVKNYIAEHPDQNVTQIAAALKVSRNTVYKYLKEVGTDMEEKKNQSVDYMVRTADGADVLIEQEVNKAQEVDKFLRAYSEKLKKEKEQSIKE